MTNIAFSDPNSGTNDAPANEGVQVGIVRRGGVRVPRRNGRPISAGHCNPASSSERPQLLRRRSASCPNLDWLQVGLEWHAVESSGYLTRTGSYKSVTADGPIIDIRHDCVKSSSPTVVHQHRPYDATPLTAEVLHYESLSDRSIIHTGNVAKEGIENIASCRVMDAPRPHSAPLLSVHIPTSTLNAS